MGYFLGTFWILFGYFSKTFWELLAYFWDIFGCFRDIFVILLRYCWETLGKLLGYFPFLPVSSHFFQFLPVFPLFFPVSFCSSLFPPAFPFFPLISFLFWFYFVFFYVFYVFLHKKGLRGLVPLSNRDNAYTHRKLTKKWGIFWELSCDPKWSSNIFTLRHVV